MSVWHRHRERLRRGERGAVIVEFALILPVLSLLALGIFEYGNLWRQVGSLERSAQLGARVATQQANGRFADYEALRAVDAQTRGMNGVEVTRVVIFRSEDPDGTIPPACLGGSVAGLCNTYTGAQVRTVNPVGFGVAGTSANPSCAGGSWDSGWCPTGRPRSTTAPLRIGVHVTVEYTPVTGLIPGPTATYSRQAIYQIEPCAQGQSSC
ncbi:MAG: TadE/TadG family type IV pilus assembly protein [Acidimicrobiales bacterium]